VTVNGGVFEGNAANGTVVALIVSFLVFTTCSSVVIRALQCDGDFDDRSEKAHSPYFGDAYLYVDYSVSCESGRYRAYRAYALLMVFVYPLGIPAVFRLRTHAIGGNKAGAGPGPAKRRASRFESGATAAAEFALGANLVTRHREVCPECKHLAFLFQEYDPACWYFEVLECARRLALTCVLPLPQSLVDPESLSHTAFATMVALVFALLYAHLKPFASDELDTFANIMQAALFCVQQIFNSTSMCAYSNVLTQALPPCFENSMGAIDPSKNQPNRLRFDRAREFQSLVGTSQTSG
jgi:hypothetical protein